MLEADGGELDAALRDLFRVTGGMWALRIKPDDSTRVAALHILRTETTTSPAALLACMREGKPVVEGSPVELDHIELRLRAAGIEVDRVRIENP